MKWLALDVGGANLKAADGRGYADVRPFALWKAPDQLTAQLGAQISSAPRCDGVVATMTGELADCYATKAEGVTSITEAIASAAAGREVAVYSTSGEFLPVDVANRRPLDVAASNWHALAAFAVRFCEGRVALLIDIGSTTADLIPLAATGPAAKGRTDPERLMSGELVYTGVERTPVSAIVSHLLWRGAECPTASELFATSADAHLLLGSLPEEANNLDSADGRPRTFAMARARLARTVCADSTMFSEDDAQCAARAICDAQLAQLEVAIKLVLQRMPEPPEIVILSGHGEFLGRALVERLSWGPPRPEVLSLNRLLGPHLSRCAPAHALAVLADERLGVAPAR
jgi:(4-(4-[2-(gamma-L-glutamylamino)ethyl]phenoxymethyl)furan-2-yl)methanamine synthase